MKFDLIFDVELNKKIPSGTFLFMKMNTMKTLI